MFHFEGQTYQFTRVPFGFRNSLASFIRALQLVLRSDSTGYVLNYVDDIIVYSNTYEEHIKHLDAVLGKLTTAGFIINIDKYYLKQRGANVDRGDFHYNLQVYRCQ